MSTRSFVLSAVSALLVCTVACGVPDRAPTIGTLDVTIAGNADVRDAVSTGTISVTRLDGTLHTRVELTDGAERRAAQVLLPPGLYGVQWEPSALAARVVEPLPAERSPRLIVVSAGSTSSVVLRTVAPRETSAAQVQASAVVGERLALR